MLCAPAAHAQPGEPPAPAQYPQVHIEWDVPITMSDGTVLKANVYRPADANGAPIDTPMPTILNMTPYTKLVTTLADSGMSVPGMSDALMSLAGRFDLTGTPFTGLADLVNALDGGFARNFSIDRDLIRSGYAQVVADVRGTGFSQGTWQVFQDREQQDTVETIDWAAAQPWSDGKVGMSGASYSGINQLQAAEKRPEHLDAIFPVVPGSDLLRDIIAPGGGLGIGFLPPWLAGVNGLKFVPDLSSLANGTFDWAWLASRVENPAVFFDLIAAALTTPTIDEIPPHMVALLEDGSSIRTDWQGDPSRIDIPTFVVGGWHDLFTNSEPRIYNAIPLPPGEKQLLMGEWYHVSAGSGLGQEGAPPRLDALQRAWFDKWLKGIDDSLAGTDIADFGPITNFQQGGDWITRTDFPDPAAEYRRLYLSPQASGTAQSVHDGSLTDEPTGDPTTLTLAPGLTTLCSRDAAQQTAGLLAAFDACGKDSRIAETNALTFTGAPVTEPTAISGPVNLHLETMLDATDGYWTATLNDVAPDGTSTALTSGQLTSSLRAVDESRSTRAPNGDMVDPFYTLTLDSRQPIVPGERTALDVGLLATDAILQPGHRLRIDVFASNFPKGMLLRPLLNESELKPQHLVLDQEAPSFVSVPLVPAR
ncbi:CocE/NonD family hydrolase [Rhodococcus sp. HNM0569]|uniref:CocE/NonD family hydrolase n=1 Tax=Rhodococcus sp. HNM0569 TaxID=2716340 RepID=UPI001F1165D7|nr:CocE/NonD family hydrolase [Rhodococcus sp. HNM0569]